MKVIIPFREDFKEAMLAGRKLMTCRTKQYGRPGDIFYAFGKPFMIEKVVKISLKEAKRHWKLEGVESPERFVEIWNELHPIKGFADDTEVFAHRFRLILYTTGEMDPMISKPKIVCLVGSVSQESDWRAHAERLTKAGYIVFEAGSYDKNAPPEVWDNITKIHHRKIELCDIVAIIKKPDRTIGKHTWADIEHGRKHGKQIEDVEYIG